MAAMTSNQGRIEGAQGPMTLPQKRSLSPPASTNRVNRPVPLSERSQAQPAVVHVKSGEVTYKDITIAAEVWEESKTMLGLLRTPGENTFNLQVPAIFFEPWLRFAHTDAGVNIPTSFPSVCQLLEVSLIMRHAATEHRAATLAAAMVRNHYRRDLHSDRDTRKQDKLHFSDGTTTAIFPCHVPDGLGAHLQAAIASLNPVSTAAAAAVVRQLTLCEALLMPPPFPAEALAQFLSLTAGVLDLSPPRVPVHCPASLHNVASALSLLLPACPAFHSLHVSAQALSPTRDAYAPLLPHLGGVSSLVITYGKVTYADLDTPTSLDPTTVAALLQHLSPTKLRRLSIDAMVDPNAEPLHRVLCSFTGLTALRLRKIPRALPLMRSLAALSITYACTDSDGQSAVLKRLDHLHPSLQHVHITGQGCCVEGIHNALVDGSGACSKTAGSGGGSLVALPAIRTCMGEAVDATGDGGQGSPRSSDDFVHCCGAQYMNDAVSLQHDSAWNSVASTLVQFIPYQALAYAWGSLMSPPLSGAGTAGLAPIAQDVLATAAGGLQHLSMVVGTCTVPGELVVLARQLLTGGVPNALRVLCVLCKRDVPHRSAICAGMMRRAKTLFEGAVHSAHGWVTARSSGVAHPLCALEMLHYASAPQGCTSSADAPESWPRDPEGPGLHTLRLSLNAFILLQDLVRADPSCFGCLRDLSVLSAEGPQPTADPRLDLACISCLTNLRTLSLQGVPRMFNITRDGTLPPSLTALLLHGYDNLRPCEEVVDFAIGLVPLNQLQCLDIVAVVCTPQGSPPSPEVLHEVKAAFFEGMQLVQQWLPLHLGARISFKTMEEQSPQESRVLSSPSMEAETNVDATLRMWLDQDESRRAAIEALLPT